MNIDIKDIFTLSDNNEYIVISKTNYQNKTYYYLVDTNNLENLKFCVEDNDSLIEILDQELIRTLIPLLANEIKDDFKDLLSAHNN